MKMIIAGTQEIIQTSATVSSVLTKTSAVDMKEMMRMAEPKILYLCKYHKDPHYCKHTSRIEDALNFSEVGGLYVENEIRKNDWIPVETRDMTEEEKKEMFETWEYCTESDCWKYDCPLPEDGQEVLVSTKWGVSLDTFCVDEGCWFENHPDRGEVLAWMPLPEPYKVGGENHDG